MGIGPVAAVRFACEIEIGFKLPEIGQHALPVPPGRAQPLPLVVVVGRAAQRHHAHHARAAAHHAGLVEAGGVGSVPGAPVRLQRRPHVALVVVGGGIHIEDVGRLVSRCGVGARFEQQHGNAGVGRQAVGHHAARRAAADNDEVEPAGRRLSGLRRSCGHGCSVPARAEDRRDKLHLLRRYQARGAASNG